MGRAARLLSLTPLLLLLGWSVRGPDGAPGSASVDAKKLMVAGPGPWSGAKLSTGAADIGAAAKAALDWLDTQGANDPLAAQPGLLGEQGVTLDRVRETLSFVARIAAEDAGKPAQRLEDPTFLAAHFDAWSWHAGAAGAPDDRVRLTRYLVWQVRGSLSRSTLYDTALYAVPEDEAGLSPEQADLKKETLLRFKYDRPAVLSGVYEEGGSAAGRAFPLVYLSRADALQAQLQGTVEVQLDSGPPRLFNVDRPNGFPYEKGAALEKQPRYWYFRPVDSVLGYGPEPTRKVRLVAGASVAGDVYNLGLGKLIALSWTGPSGRVVRLAVLGDTGGAFQPNLGQLDLYAGAFPDKDSFQAATRDIPDRVEASILLVRP